VKPEKEETKKKRAHPQGGKWDWGLVEVRWKFQKALPGGKGGKSPIAEA